ncbi:MAG: peptidase M14 [Acidobacteria bacterium]|nr:peptidase M14 [Acidobacteriota bacterium]MSO61393.1 peptidase M14 [Acidobacteriota bacterium]
MRARSIGLLLAFLLTAPLGGQAPAAIPTPEAAFGFRMGTDRELADWPGLQRYFETVAAASDRVEIVDAGPSTDGRRLIAAVVSAPENIARLEQIRANALRLADPRTLDEPAAMALAERQPVIVALGMSIHATEIGATQAAPELLHTLATSRDPEVLRALREVVLILFPSLNPDGHVITVDWYRQWKGTEFEGSNMPWLYHHYVGHDLNRDAFMMNMAENRSLADFFYRRWHPQVFLTMHQMGPRGARFFVPPNLDPIDRNYDPLIWRTAGLLGHAMALSLEQDGHSGVLQNALYDYYWPGYEDSAPLGHNTVTILTEAASVRIASPITVAPDQLTGGRGFPDHSPSTTFPNPWPGGDWRLRDIVNYDLSAARGMLGAAARYREELVRNFYRMGKRQVELGLKGGPFAFIIPPGQFDPHAARKLEQLLLEGAVEIRRTIEPFRVADTVYPQGSDIILMAQPFRAYAKTLLETQQYPVRRLAPGAQVDRPYDVAGWTLPLQMNVKIDRIDQYFEPPPTTRLDRATIAPAQVWGDTRKPAFYVIDGRGNGASLAINRLQKAGARVSWLASAMAIQGYTYQPGALVVVEAKGVRQAVDGVARDLGLRVTASAGRPPPDARPLGRARLALYKPWVESIDEGWTRWLLEQYEFPFENLTDADIRRGGLGARFDAIIIPDLGADRLIAGHPAGTMPPEYVGGLGTDGAEMLRQFVTGGGTLVTLDSASELAVTLLGAPVTDVTRGLPPGDFFCPGSVIKLELDPDPLTYGLPRETAGFCAFSGAFELAPAAPTAAAGLAVPTARIIGRYAKSGVLLSGWLEGEGVIAGKGAMVEVTAGLGRAILFAFRPQHRAQSHATFRLFFNALHTAR